MINQIDLSFFQKLNDFAGAGALSDKIIVFFASQLPYLLVCAFVIFLLLQKRDRIKAFLQPVLALILSRFVITEIIHLLFHRPRPFIILEAAKRLVLTPLSENLKSFPSGHAAFFFALSTAIFLEDKKTGSIFLFASCLMGIARVAAGVHWPTDIMGGAAIGVLSALIVKLIAQKWEQMRKK